MRLTKTSIINASVDELFEFCLSQDGFEIQFPYKICWLQVPEIWKKGSVITFKFKIAKFFFWNIWIKSKAEIVELEINKHFIGVLRIGSCKFFRHRHEFETVGNKTSYTDVIEFTLGFGRFIDYWIGLKYLEKHFNKRHRNLKKYFSFSQDMLLNFDISPFT